MSKKITTSVMSVKLKENFLAIPQQPVYQDEHDHKAKASAPPFISPIPGD
jgi:hypothetical protein